MTFVEAFYSFNLDITNVDTGHIGKARVKTPKHPYESYEHLYARTLALVHAWEKGLTFSHGYFEPDEPTIWKQDVLGNLESWIEVSCPERKKILAALRSALPPPHKTRFAVYFYNDEQILKFCDSMRGSKENWISDISFYRIDLDILEALISLKRSSANWSVTIIDNNLYLYCDGHELSTTIHLIDMWQQFQESIDNITKL